MPAPDPPSALVRHLGKNQVVTLARTRGVYNLGTRKAQGGKLQCMLEQEGAVVDKQKSKEEDQVCESQIGG